LGQPSTEGTAGRGITHANGPAGEAGAGVFIAAGRRAAVLGTGARASVGERGCRRRGGSWITRLIGPDRGGFFGQREIEA